MKVVFKPGKQKELLTDVIKKVGSERKVSNLTGISKGAIYRYRTEKALIPTERLNRLLALTKRKTEFSSQIVKELCDNWGQIKGGLKLIDKKRKAGTFQITIDKLKKASSERMKAWHRAEREKSPINYHILQYERFKKIGGYNIDCGFIKVRNSLEAEISKILRLNKVDFEYEPCIVIGSKAYFPDFKVGNYLIEATYWSHPSANKLSYLKKKVNDYKHAGYHILFVIPSSHRKFYKGIGSTIISDVSKLTSIFAPVA